MDTLTDYEKGQYYEYILDQLMIEHSNEEFALVVPVFEQFLKHKTCTATAMEIIDYLRLIDSHYVINTQQTVAFNKGKPLGLRGVLRTANIAFQKYIDKLRIHIKVGLDLNDKEEIDEVLKEFILNYAEQRPISIFKAARVFDENYVN